jgi:exportin-7
MNEDDIKKFEVLSEMLFSPNKDARTQAEQQLAIFNSVESLPKLQLIIQKTRNTHALFFICSQILKLFTNHWNVFNKKQPVEMRNFLLHYLGNNGINMPDTVSKAMLQLLGRITKLGWLDEPTNRELPDQVKKFFIQSNNPNMAVVGMQILNSVINEMNTLTSRKSLTQHRKIAVSFRDSALRSIFETGIAALTEIQRNPSGFPEKFSAEALNLVLNCLKFDFVGIFPDESTDDIGTVQIPATWRPLFEENDIVTLFWKLYSMLSPASQVKVLHILVHLASVRRSLFTGDDERKTYLVRFVNGIEQVLQNNFGLGSQECYHEFCRLLARLKANFQLNEFVACNNYNSWLEKCANFTVASFKNWEFSAPSVYYLLNFWSRLIASKPYLKSETPSHLETFVPEICKQYLLSRMDLAKGVVLNEAIENPLENEQNLEEQLESIPQLVHANYELSGGVMQSLFDPLLAQYQEQLRVRAISKFNEVECQLAWLVYIIGAVIGKRYVSAGSSDDAEIMDANLSARCLRCIGLVNERIAMDSSAIDDEYVSRLESAILHFLKNFKRVYLGDTMISHPKLFSRMKELLNIPDQASILNVFVNKIMNNLKIWAKSEAIIKETLTLFDDIATGYSSAKLATKLETVIFILNNHSVEHFPFLNYPKNMRVRTTFYNILCKLLFLQNFTEDTFLEFMRPLERTCMQLEQIPTIEQFRSEQVKFVLMGWLRDLRGICNACANRRTYTMFFDWLYPAHMPLLLKSVQAWNQSPDIMIALLKFVWEFVYNRNQRISFGSSSPNGILLFKETSKLLVAFGTGIAKSPPMTKDVYAEKYKPVMLAMGVLLHALSGDYCNFGVFQLYNDRALLDALDVVVKLALMIPLQDIMAYPKVCKAYFALVESLFNNHTETVIMFDTPIFLKLVSSLEEGIRLDDLSLSSQVCSALDHLLTFYYKQSSKNTKMAELLHNHLHQNKNLFPRILAQLFNLILFEECGNQWSVSRTMLALIVTHQGVSTKV